MADELNRPEEPGTGPRSDGEIDAAFAEIVARWDTTSPDGEPVVAPEAEEPPDSPAADAATDTGPAAAVVIPVWRGGTGGSVTDLLADGDDSSGDDDGDEVTPDEEFTPPTPQPLPPLSDRLFWGALGGLVAGPALLILLAVLRPGWGGWVTGLGLALTLGGFACLVMRQPAHREDDPDQGARV